MGEINSPLKNIVIANFQGEKVKADSKEEAKKGKENKKIEKAEKAPKTVDKNANSPNVIKEPTPQAPNEK